MAMSSSGSGHYRRRGGRLRGRRAVMAEINVTPMVDVMLVLLIVFMVTAPLLSTGVAVDLPEASSSPLPGQDEPLSVTVSPKGEIYLQDTVVALDELAPRLIAITQNNPQARIFVRGDRAIDYGTVMAVVGTVNRAGFSKVALVTEQPRVAAGS